MKLIQIVLRLLVNADIDISGICYISGTNNNVRIIVDSERARKRVTKAFANKVSLNNCQVTSVTTEKPYVGYVTVTKHKQEVLYLTGRSYA